jgi:hypothetical protein
MAKNLVRKMSNRNVAAIGVIGSMAFCLPDTPHGILIVPTGFDPYDGNGWG